MLTNISTAQTVVIVNGNREALELLETVLEGRHYHIVFVESSDHAYSQIKRVQPHLVILYMRIDDIYGFQVLSVLKLDEATQRIPILTYTTEYDGQDPDDSALETAETEVFTPKAAVWVN
jgi:CheY-like chemotaxis protein